MTNSRFGPSLSTSREILDIRASQKYLSDHSALIWRDGRGSLSQEPGPGDLGSSLEGPAWKGVLVSCGDGCCGDSRVVFTAFQK